MTINIILFLETRNRYYSPFSGIRLIQIRVFIPDMETDKKNNPFQGYCVVRTERLELSHLSAPEPKSGASTNFATSASKATDYTHKPIKLQSAERLEKTV